MRLPKFLQKLKKGINRLFSKRRSAKRPPKRIKMGSEKGGINELALVPENHSPSPIAAIQDFSGIQLSRHTQRAYKRDLQDFFGYLRTKDIWDNWSNQVSPSVVADFRRHLIEGKNLSKSSATRKLAVVKSFYRWTMAQGYLSRNPADLVRGFPQTQESKTGFLTDDEIGKFLSNFGKIPECGIFEALSKVSVETLLMLGLRRSEACQIRVGDLEYSESRWLVRIQPGRLCQNVIWRPILRAALGK